MTGTAAAADSPVEWAQCHCCGRTYPVTSMVNFHNHPGDRVCSVCIYWMYRQARPIAARLLSERIPLGSRIRAWIAGRRSAPEPCPVNPGA